MGVVGTNSAQHTTCYAAQLACKSQSQPNT